LDFIIDSIRFPKAITSGCIVVFRIRFSIREN
jgi:hypothetical protein